MEKDFARLELFLEFGKGFLVFFCPVPGAVLLQEALKRSGEEAVVADEFPVPIAESKEGLQLLECLWSWPGLDGVESFLRHGNSIG